MKDVAVAYTGGHTGGHAFDSGHMACIHQARVLQGTSFIQKKALQLHTWVTLLATPRAVRHQLDCQLDALLPLLCARDAIAVQAFSSQGLVMLTALHKTYTNWDRLLQACLKTGHGLWNGCWLQLTAGQLPIAPH